MAKNSVYGFKKNYLLQAAILNIYRFKLVCVLLKLIRGNRYKFCFQCKICRWSFLLLMQRIC